MAAVGGGDQMPEFQEEACRRRNAVEPAAAEVYFVPETQDRGPSGSAAAARCAWLPAGGRIPARVRPLAGVAKAT
jgi:proline racemase